MFITVEYSGLNPINVTKNVQSLHNYFMRKYRIK